MYERHREQPQHPAADRIERGLLDADVDTTTARRLTVLGQPIEACGQAPVRLDDFTFRPQALLIVLWARWATAGTRSGQGRHRT
ncbi:MULTISPECIES: hypothetical protein [unclassified Streptomyces]|uniref:hypothetical protein n=1 Tax=unclassified Streptomyces TaxID=2593676 RepID=UPI000BACE255|nr:MULTISPECIES: hypothetical protein [unclassified Streptomyces]ASY37079.1 hypothetical protein CAC01_31090 [Streptomyces sp. CLI2509]MYX24181.1 hypothetical protein [Streptomyces sp. SID8380]